MKEFRDLLREAPPEAIGGFIVAVITTLTSGIVTGQWQLSVLIGCVTIGVIAGLAYFTRSQVDRSQSGEGSHYQSGEGIHPGPSSASIGFMHRIPSGLFIMGSDLHPREAPIRSVYLPEFEIGHVPVMVGQYQAFLDSGGANECR